MTEEREEEGGKSWSPSLSSVVLSIIAFASAILLSI